MIRRLLVALTACLLVALPLQQAGAVPACAPVGNKIPIILVHGFNSGPGTWGNDTSPTVANALKKIPNTYIERFTYQAASKSWVDNPRIGPELAARISCVASSSKAAGGIGKVIIVGHSMGGLAARYAANVTRPDGHKTSEDIGLVVTLGTPNTGSILGNLGSSVLLQSICEGRPTQAASAEYDGCLLDAIAGLGMFSKQLETLSILPDSIPLLSIAGEETLHAKVFLLSLPVHQNTYSDLVVGTGSALKYSAQNDKGGGQKTKACTSDILHALAADCMHVNLTHNPEIAGWVADAVNKYVRSTEKPVTRSSPAPAAKPTPATSSLQLSSVVGTWRGGSTTLTIRSNGDAVLYAPGNYGESSSFYSYITFRAATSSEINGYNAWKEYNKNMETISSGILGTTQCIGSGQKPPDNWTPASLPDCNKNGQGQTGSLGIFITPAPGVFGSRLPTGAFAAGKLFCNESASTEWKSKCGI